MIVPMKRLTLVALKEDEGAILKALQSAKAVQVIQTGDAAMEDDDLSLAEGRVQRLNNALSLLKPYAEKKGMLSPKPEMTAEELRSELDEALVLSEELEAADRNRAAVRGQMEKYNAQIAALTPWQTLTTPMTAIKGTKNTTLFAGVMRADQKKRLEELPETAAVQALESNTSLVAALVLCAKEDADQVAGLIKQLEWNDVQFPQMDMTPSQAIEHYRGEIKKLEEKAEEIERQMKQLGERNAVVAGGADAAAIERDRAKARLAIGKTAATFFLEGWVREDQVEKVEAAVQAVTDAYCTEYRDPAEDEEPPVSLKNSKIIEPYEGVINLYSMPKPGTGDATAHMAPFYFLFFGMMLADTGYGIVLTIGSWLFQKFMKPEGMMKSICGILFQGGISTIIMGLLLGTFCGIPWPDLLPNTFIGQTFPLIDSATDPISMLILCFGLGLVHMFYAVFLNAIACFKRGDWMAAIVDNLAWFFIIVGFLLLAAPMIGLPQGVATFGLYMAIFFAVVVFLFAGRAKGFKLGRFISGAGKLYDVTSWLSDVLSYARIFALGLSGGVIGLVLNTLGSMLYSAFQANIVMQIIGFILTAAVLVFLHTFMLAINGLGCFVHTARLQYVEFFGKFYNEGGKPFRPLGYKTKHVRVQD